MEPALKVVDILAKSHTFILYRAYEKAVFRVVEVFNKDGNGLEIKDMWVVLATGKINGLNQKQMSEMLRFNVNSMVKIINKLEKLRLIKRITRPGNRRERVLTLTKQGIDVCKRLELIIEMYHYKILEPLTMAETDLVRTLLTKFITTT